jgi:hypothetical protein
VTLLFFAVPQVRARFLGANLGAARVIGILVNFVILSEAKDPAVSEIGDEVDPMMQPQKFAHHPQF